MTMLFMDQALQICLLEQVTEDQLRAIFHRFGEIVYVKIPAGKGCGFVQFMGRTNAEAAMLAMNGQVRSFLLIAGCLKCA